MKLAMMSRTRAQRTQEDVFRHIHRDPHFYYPALLVTLLRWGVAGLSAVSKYHLFKCRLHSLGRYS